jgi:hypothetical protein
VLSYGAKRNSGEIIKGILITTQKYIDVSLLTLPTVLCDYAFSMLKLKNKILKQLTGNESSRSLTAAEWHMTGFPCD